jgi:tetratricopeptide (TPR) repeat protein
VQQAHSVPLQWLNDLGVVGALLGVGALALLFTAAARRLPVPGSERERDLAGALLAAAAAWGVHALFDWDWDIPGVTVPVLLFLGVLGARRPAERPATEVLFEEPRPVRPLALFCAGLLACAFIVSAVLPAWSDRKADDALAAAGDRSPERLEAAAADAELAADLDPLAVRPLFAAAAVAEARGRLLEARAHLLDAVERQPYSLEAWRRLTRVAAALADREGVQRASERALELDPGDEELIRFVSRAQGILTPPEASATAIGTPLPSAVGTAPPPEPGE